MLVTTGIACEGAETRGEWDIRGAREIVAIATEFNATGVSLIQSLTLSARHAY